MSFEKLLYDENIIFHYTNSQVAFEHILPSKSLRFSIFENTNDPFEYKKFYTNAALWSDGSIEQHENIYKTIDFIGDSRKKKYQVSCFTSNSKSTNDPIEFRRGLGCAKSRMWSQYGDKHYGVVLAFNKSKLLAELESPIYNCRSIFSSSIFYEHYDDRNFPVIDGNRISEVGIEEYSYEFLNTNQKEFFFTKNPDYRDENEFRIIINPKSHNNTLVNIESSLVSIIIGDRFPLGLIPNLKFYSDQFKVNCRRIFWEKGIPQIHFIRPPEDSFLKNLVINEYE